MPAQTLPASSADALLRRVDSHYNHLSSLGAHFVERYSGLGQTRTESGTLLLKKPGRMRWNYDAPQGRVFLLDGTYAWFYTPGDPQVQRVPAGQIDDLRTPLRFLLGHTALRKELGEIVVTQQDSSLKITGIPKGTKRVEQVSLLVTPFGEIKSISLTEPDGSAISFDFSDSQENVPTRETDFHFFPPAGVAIVNGAPPL